jgi:hypothetical protein
VSVLVVGQPGTGTLTLVDDLLTSLPEAPVVVKSGAVPDRSSYKSVRLADAEASNAPLVVRSPKVEEAAFVVMSRLAGRQALVSLPERDLPSALKVWPRFTGASIPEGAALESLFNLAVVLTPLAPAQLLSPATLEAWSGVEDLLTRDVPDPAEREALIALAPGFTGTYEELVTVAREL